MKNILIIDDEIQIVEILKEFLTEQGFSIKTAENGREGLNVQEKEGFDLIIIDEKMPVMSGTSFLKEIRKLKPEIPVITLTGSVTVGRTTLSKSSKANHILFKPIRLSELLSVINSLIPVK